jgi:hypothetical protein
MTMTATLLLIALTVTASAEHPSQRIGNYARTEGTYTVQNGGTAFHVANRLVGQDCEALRNHVAREIAHLNGKPLAHRYAASEVLRVPRYKADQRVRCGDLLNWYWAVRAGEAHGVCPALMIGIRTLENPSPARDHYAYGVKTLRGTTLERQAFAAARALSRYRVTWDPKTPTRDALQRVGRIYCPPEAAHWTRSVHALRQRALGGN